MIVGLIYGKITSVTTTKSTIYYVTHIGDWPSGKAPGSGPVIGGSNPSSPAMKNDRTFVRSFFIVLWSGLHPPNEFCLSKTFGWFDTAQRVK